MPEFHKESRTIVLVIIQPSNLGTSLTYAGMKYGNQYIKTATGIHSFIPEALSPESRP